MLHCLICFAVLSTALAALQLQLKATQCLATRVCIEFEQICQHISEFNMKSRRRKKLKNTKAIPNANAYIHAYIHAWVPLKYVCLYYNHISTLKTENTSINDIIEAHLSLKSSDGAAKIRVNRFFELTFLAADVSRQAIVNRWV